MAANPSIAAAIAVGLKGGNRDMRCMSRIHSILGQVSGFLECMEKRKWYKVSSFVSLVLLLTLIVDLKTFGYSPGILGYTWLISSYTFYPLMLFSFILLFENKIGFVIEPVVLIVLWIFSLWFIASSYFYIEEGRNLLWYEIEFYFFESGYRDYMWELLFSRRLLIFIFLFFGGYLGLRFFYRNYVKGKVLFFCTMQVMAAVMILGVAESQSTVFRHGTLGYYYEPASSPWSIAHRPYANDKTRAFDFEVARNIRETEESPFWAAGPDEKLASLAGRYRGRSIIVVLLESHRASDISGLGEGAVHHHNLSPTITRYMNEGITFTNHIAAGQGTWAARWSIMTGLNNPPGETPPILQEPEASKIGRMPQMRQSGYDCMVLSAANPQWDNWGQITADAGCEWGLNRSLMTGADGVYRQHFDFRDDLLFTTALNKYKESVANNRAGFFIVQALSNHEPYEFPSEITGRKMPHNHEGGMLFADYALGILLDGLKQLPQEQEPVIFITSDTANQEGLISSRALGSGMLEGLRIPGLLLLPDRQMSGEIYDGLFCHEDILDLMYMLVSSESKARMIKFLKRHRVVAPTCRMTILLTQSTYFSLKTGDIFAIKDRWKLEPAESSKDLALFLATKHKMLSLNKRLWNSQDQL
jgi:phosphoglycerol transferase MdoB-like AlkP superfamily enzyme